MGRRKRLAEATVLAALASACVLPSTRFEPIAREVVQAEELRQQRLVIQWHLQQAQRLEDVGHGLLTSAKGFCESIVARPGILLRTAHDFGPDLEQAARSLGFSDTLMIAGVARGSAAERAGLRAGDRVLGYANRQAARGRGALADVTRRVGSGRLSGALALRVMPGPARFHEQPDNDSLSDQVIAQAVRDVAVPVDTACAYGLSVKRDDAVNAYADGRNIVVNTGLLRYLNDDDELAAVIAHEIAHNAKRHIDAKTTNSLIGGLLGAIVDVAAATQGVRTDGQFSKIGASAGGVAFSQAFELEADYVGLYIMARAGRAVARAPNLWRRMAQENPTSITFAGTHPTSAERFLRLDATVGEIKRKEGSQLALVPSANAPGASAVPGRATEASRPTTDERSAARSIDQPRSVALAVAPRDSATIPTDRTSKPATGAPRPAPSVNPSGVRGGRRVMPLDPTAPYFEWKIGPPVPRDGLSLAQVIVRARAAYERGVQAREVGWLERARDEFYEATQLQGDEPVYQAALGWVLLREGHWAEAEAVLSAAVLLAPENEEYRRLLTESRRRK